MTSLILIACVAFGFAAAAPNQLGEIGNLLGGIGPVLGGNDLDLGAGKTNPVSLSDFSGCFYFRYNMSDIFEMYDKFK